MYQELYAKLEDFAQELEVCKVSKVFYRMATEQAELWDERPVRLQDGTTSMEKVKGYRYSTKITLTAIGIHPPEMESKVPPLNPPKPDTQLVFTDTLIEKDCWSRQEGDAYGMEVDAGWKAVISQVKTVWKKSAFFEGVASILPGD